jgi:formylglycine-generating enzyme required for sulfatase activity
VTPFYFGKTISTDQANYNRTYQKTVEVGRFPTNAWGLHDMHGNVWEWTQSIYNKNYDESGRGRMELGQSIVHVLRGGVRGTTRRRGCGVPHASRSPTGASGSATPGVFAWLEFFPEKP